MGMSSSQPQPVTQGTMGSPTKSYGPVGGMLNSAQNQVNPQPQQPMGNPGFMPMGNAGFMPMGNHNFMPTGFGQMPQQPQMPTFGGPRGGKAPQ